MEKLNRMEKFELVFNIRSKVVWILDLLMKEVQLFGSVQLSSFVLTTLMGFLAMW